MPATGDCAWSERETRRHASALAAIRRETTTDGASVRVGRDRTLDMTGNALQRYAAACYGGIVLSAGVSAARAAFGTRLRSGDLGASARAISRAGRQRATGNTPRSPR